jgi:hypothetical protein
VGQGVAEFAAFVDGAGSFGRDVTGNSTRKRKLLEEFLHALFVLRNVRIEFAVGSFEIDVGDDARSAVTGPGDIDDVEIVLFDQAIEVEVDEIQARRGAPVAEEARFDVFDTERLAQHRVGEQIDLADGKIVGGAPVGVHLTFFFDRERTGGSVEHDRAYGVGTHSGSFSASSERRNMIVTQRELHSCAERNTRGTALN